jgi:hypothetical protein
MMLAFGMLLYETVAGMGRKLELANQRFGRLVALARRGRDPKGQYLWHCRCDCGSEKAVRGTDLAAGKSQSCGCSWSNRPRKYGTPDFKAKRAAYDRLRWLTDRAVLVAKNLRNYTANAEAYNAQKRQYRLKNIVKATADQKAWAARNRHVIRELNAGRKRHIARATPAWADAARIRAVYAEAERLTLTTGVTHHVDHVIPLKGKNVCGLHVHGNLRPLPWRENIQKKNKFAEAVPA